MVSCLVKELEMMTEDPDGSFDDANTHTDTPAFIASNVNIKDLCVARCIHACFRA